MFSLALLLLGDAGYKLFWRGPSLREAWLHPSEAGITFPEGPCRWAQQHFPQVEPGTSAVLEARGPETRPETELGICQDGWAALQGYQEIQRLLAEPEDSNTPYFHVVIAGPQHSHFEGGTFKLELLLPEEYLMAASKVHFMTKIHHPNVDRLRRTCVDVVEDTWCQHCRCPVLLGTQALRSAPSPDDP